MNEAPNKRAGGAYLVKPEEGPGPGVLVLSSGFGLRDSVKDYCDALSDHGFSVVAPDLTDGRLAATPEEAGDIVAETTPDAVAALIVSSAVALRAHSASEADPVAVVGFSMGASWALWLATRQPESVSKLVAYYGTTNLDFEDLTAPVLGHFGDEDSVVSEDELTEMHAHLLLLERNVRIETYPGAQHWFAETDRPEFNGEHADLAWLRTIEFLKSEGS